MLTITAPPRVFCRSSYWRERSNGALLIYECQVVAKYFSLEILDVLLISCDILRVRKKNRGKKSLLLSLLAFVC